MGGNFLGDGGSPPLVERVLYLSQGHFDVTIGPLVDLWNIHNGEGHYPTQEELDATLPLINSDDLLVEEGRAYLAGKDDRQSRCHRQGIHCRPGQGFIGGARREACRHRSGTQHSPHRRRPDGSNFTVGVQDPNQEEGVLADTVAASDKAW